MLLAYLRAIAFDEELVDDVFQETLVAAWDNLASFDTARPFGPWLRGLARRRLLNHARGERRYRRHVENYEQEVTARFNRIDSAEGDTFFDKVAEIRSCLSELPQPQRDAIELVYVPRARHTRGCRRTRH